MTHVLKAIGAVRLVPVIVINEEENAYPLASRSRDRIYRPEH